MCLSARKPSSMRPPAVCPSQHRTPREAGVRVGSVDVPQRQPPHRQTEVRLGSPVFRSTLRIGGPWRYGPCTAWRLCDGNQPADIIGEKPSKVLDSSRFVNDVSRGPHPCSTSCRRGPASTESVRSRVRSRARIPQQTVHGGRRRHLAQATRPPSSLRNIKKNSYDVPSPYVLLYPCST